MLTSEFLIILAHSGHGEWLSGRMVAIGDDQSPSFVRVLVHVQPFIQTKGQTVFFSLYLMPTGRLLSRSSVNPYKCALPFNSNPTVRYGFERPSFLVFISVWQYISNEETALSALIINLLIEMCNCEVLLYSHSV